MIQIPFAVIRLTSLAERILRAVECPVYRSAGHKGSGYADSAHGIQPVGILKYFALQGLGVDSLGEAVNLDRIEHFRFFLFRQIDFLQELAYCLPSPDLLILLCI